MSRRARVLVGLPAFVVSAAMVAGPSSALPVQSDDAVSSSSKAKVNVKEYVALGDSYSAGPLIPAQRVDPLGCLRSTNNYPAFLATYFKLTNYTDVTCSGAETTDMWESQEMIVPTPVGGLPPAPQLDALTKTTDLVTLGIGGNDYGLFGSLISDCEAAAENHPKGAPCRKMYTNDKGVDTKLRDARRIQKRVAKVVRAIDRRAPRADVFVFGYPRLLPEKGTCDAVPFAKGDYRWGDKVERRLNKSIRNAAENNGATFVNLYPVSKGHTACAGDRAWINGSEIDPVRAANFHPFLKGMRGISRKGYRQITGNKAPKISQAAVFPGVPTADLTRSEARFLGGRLFKDLAR